MKSNAALMCHLVYAEKLLSKLLLYYPRIPSVSEVTGLSSLLILLFSYPWQVCNTIRHPLHKINYILSGVCDGFNYTHLQSLYTRVRVVNYLTSSKDDYSMANIYSPYTRDIVQAGKINFLFCMHQGFII